MLNDKAPIGEVQTQDFLRRVQSGTRIDVAAYLALVTDMDQSHEDAVKFASRFCLRDNGCQPKSVDESILSHALLNHGVTVDEIIKFDQTLGDVDFEDEAIQRRNAYLGARCRGVSHADLVRDAPTSSA